MNDSEYRLCGNDVTRPMMIVIHNSPLFYVTDKLVSFVILQTTVLNAGVPVIFVSIRMKCVHSGWTA